MLGRSLLLPTALALALAGGARAQDAVDPAELQGLYAAGRYGEALERTSGLADPVLAAEWRTYLFLAGGDLPAALTAARQGLALAPDHPGLLVNAIQAALTLGLAEEALERIEALDLALAAGQPGPEELERVDRLREAALAQLALEARGQESLLRARIGVAAAGIAVLGALLLLGLRPVPRAS